LEGAIGRIDRRLTEIGEELMASNHKTIDKEELAADLSEFAPIWDELYPAEKARIVSLLVERTEYDALMKSVQIAFRPSGIEDLPQE
jgi:hypothetical protein